MVLAGKHFHLKCKQNHPLIYKVTKDKIKILRVQIFNCVIVMNAIKNI